MKFRIEIVTEPARLAAVRDQWQDLWARAGSHVFQTHDWISGWVSGVRDRKEIRLQIALAWDGDSLVGIMPCATYRRSGLRILRWAAELFSDYCDCVIDPAYGRSVVLTSLWDGMRAQRRLRPDQPATSPAGRTVPPVPRFAVR